MTAKANTGTSGYRVTGVTGSRGKGIKAILATITEPLQSHALQKEDPLAAVCLTYVKVSRVILKYCIVAVT